LRFSVRLLPWSKPLGTARSTVAPAGIRPADGPFSGVISRLPPFAKPGQPIEVTVSSIGNAKRLRGGSLLMTPLKGIDGQDYAVAQDNLVVGGVDAEGRDGSKITLNVPSDERI
ncbi:flagellar basal body P-ring protein FlgI, partial [Pseudomonas aeruginosa]